MTVRRAWLAGSLPGETPYDAMQLALDTLGPWLYALPSGETSRPMGIHSVVNDLADTGLFGIRSTGDFIEGAPVDYNHMPQLAVTRDLRTLDLGYYDLYRIESKIAKELIIQHNMALSYQVGIPSPFSLAMTALGPARALRWLKEFSNATAHDVAQIYNSDETTLFSIEASWELTGMMALPAAARGIAIRRLISRIVDFIALCPAGMRIGVHPCLGDLQHTARAQLPRLGLLVDWVNELVKQWPTGYTLAYVHLPLAEGASPPVLETSWYTSLTRLRIPAGTRVIAGLCHEAVTAAELMPVVRFMELLLRRAVVVGASCGLAPRGTRTAEVARIVLEQQRTLCTTDE